MKTINSFKILNESKLQQVSGGRRRKNVIWDFTNRFISFFMAQK
ncbi:ComC/BlpC family leader-containing pheromone/bacteriocin [Lactobacillus sp. DCY120]|uniref:ComC/BlpC family leader-containing pheromone/bacteriocin n=1 Tax=Bombilactobacillus apium TaxID=2675299 RepID=A0A850R7A5_9LACO|nr:ComC/BlpC family leader-containing pheromone/bacteriocin [Bombilactobacillus apium]